MTKNLALLMLCLISAFTLFSKNSFLLEEIDFANFDNTTSKLIESPFRYDNNDYLVIQPQNNSVNLYY